ncbi:MAG: hypothetical protein SGPRY_001043 [Prymnesium sp.]
MGPRKKGGGVSPPRAGVALQLRPWELRTICRELAAANGPVEQIHSPASRFRHFSPTQRGHMRIVVPLGLDAALCTDPGASLWLVCRMPRACSHGQVHAQPSQPSASETFAATTKSTA